MAIPPNQTEVASLFALLGAGRYAELEDSARNLLAQHPGFGLGWHILGAAQQAQGKDALAAFQQAAQIMPDSAEAQGALGLALRTRGNLNAALASFRRALQLAPNAAEAHFNLANTLSDLGKAEEASAGFRRALEINPAFAAAHFNLGNALRDLGQPDAACACYRQAIACQPDYAYAHNNLGNLLRDLGQLKEAEICFRQAIRYRPDYAHAHNNLGNTLRDLGQSDAAIASYRLSIQLQPDNAEAHCNLGNALRAAGHLDEAAASARRALEIAPGFAEAHHSLGLTLEALGQMDAAEASHAQALALKPDSLQYATHLHLLLPILPESNAAIAHWRERYRTGIETLCNSELDRNVDKFSAFSFYLAYHNQDDRPLMQALQRMFRLRAPDLAMSAAHVAHWQDPQHSGRRIRVGFLSEFLCDHTIGKHYLGFLQHLDRRRFEVVLIHGPATRQDAVREQLDAAADKVVQLPARLLAQQQAVAAMELDVLFFTDIGMCASTYLLAHARLAPVQFTGWGHPDTSGLDTLDYYLSAAGIEAEDADKYYSERLIRLNRLPCFYYRTPDAAIPQLTRAELGLPPAGTLYGCLQHLFKFHPDFDAVLAEIAAGDPAGHIVLPEGQYGAWSGLLRARWARTFPQLAQRVVFLPRLSWTRFMAAMAQMDVLLDPLHFGSGNTLYDAMVHGTPLVTWPGRFGRGRNVAAAYLQMGIADAPIAAHMADYAPLALTLGRDPERRATLRAASRQAAQRELFEDLRAVREFESFLVAAVSAAAKSEKLPAGWCAPAA